MVKTKKSQTTYQIVAPVKTPIKKANGLKNLIEEGSTRSFENRFEPRYSEIPPVPSNLPEQSFSEPSIKILKERYLLKGGDLKVAETVTERFWHLAYDIASGDFDFGYNKSQVLETAKDFYRMMVRQEFLPNSPTIMNAGKQNGLQYSACFVLPVEDSIPEIFDTMKYAALIHQSGGGCISADARVWTTFCGIEPIEVLFSRATVDGRVGIRQGSGTAYDVGDLNIQTVSMNPKTGETGLKKVTHVWKYDVAAQDQIIVKTAEGTRVQTSTWHPFMAFRGTSLAEVRADELVAGDIVLGPYNPANFWPWKRIRRVGLLPITADLAWLIGFTLGDGSFGYVKALRQYRVRWFSGTEDVLVRVQEILSGLGINVSIQKDNRGLLSISTLNQKFVHNLLQGCGLEKFGPKDDLIRVPEIIAKSPLKIVRAFLAGLMDSDGYVASDGSPSYTSVSEAMSQDLAALMGLLGYHPSVKKKAPYGKGKLPTYTVQLCPLSEVNRLAKEILSSMYCQSRKVRLLSDCKKQTALALDFRSFRDKLALLGLVNARFDRANHGGPFAKELSHWASHKRISRNDLRILAKKVKSYDKEFALMLFRIADSGQEVKVVEKAKIAKTYYDLSVDDWNTYAAGESGMVMIHNTGFAFSRLRPNGSRVKRSGGVASGPVSFLRVYDAATQSIKQGGTRRGANMGILRIDHPDILEFIRCKAELDEQNQPVYDSIAPFLPDDMVKKLFKTKLLDTQISNFNISCAVTDKFMDAYYKGDNYELTNPATGEVDGTLNAKAVMDEIVERAWNTGDPGLVFIDRINNSPANPVPELETIESTNPCVTGDTLVATDGGWRRADQIHVGDRIGTVLGGGIVDQVESHESKPVYKIKLSDGAELRVTKAHQFHAIKVKDRVKNSANKHFSQISLKDLEVGDVLRISPALMPDRPVMDLPDGWREKDYGFFIGMLLGDGCITEKTLSRNVVKIAINTSEVEWTAEIKRVLEKTGSKVVTVNYGRGFSANLVVQSIDGAVTMVNKSFLKPSYSFEKSVPLEYQNTNRDFLAGLLDGLFSTDGNINLTTTHPQIRFKTTSKQLALDIRRILLYFGMHGRIHTVNRVADGLIDGRAIISRHQQYEVIISGAGIKIFADQVGITHPDKKKKIQRALMEYSLTGNTWLAHILSIESDGMEKVYDLHEPGTDTWITEGVVSRGCGEQPLAPWDACNLGSINLGKFVKADMSIDWEGLRECVRKSVHFLDNVVQTNPFSIKEIYDEVHNNRRIGLGVMGWADMLFRMKVSYDSLEAIELAEKVMKFINEEGHLKSEELAQEKGPFPNWSHSIYKNGKPLRNSTVTTIAPTGTISIIGDCASGIEPVFALAYLHKAKGDGGKTGNEIRTLTIANMTFTEIAKRENFYSDDLAQKVMDQGSVDGVEAVPMDWQSIFVTAPEIGPIQHVKMQAAFQRYTDNGVSKTINMPNSVTVEDVKTAYLLAWETGCNGITIYRDGSKAVQVLNVASTLKPKVEETHDEIVFSEGDPRESRPMILRGRTYEIMTPVGKAFVTVNRDESEMPFEVFITVGKGGMHTTADAEAIGRLTSIALRVAKNYRKEIAEKIVQQLRGIGGSSQIGFGKDRVMSLADAIAKVLAEDLSYVNQKEEVVEALPLNLTENDTPSIDDVVAQSRVSEKLMADLCPSCGDAAFVFEEGCKKCHSCGYSLC